MTSGQWEEQTESINFATVNFVITEHRLKQDVQTEVTNGDEQEEGIIILITTNKNCAFVISYFHKITFIVIAD